MHLEKSFCDHCCVQTTVLFTATIGKGSLEKEQALLKEFVWTVNSFFVQYNAPLVEYLNIAQYLNLFCQKWPVFSQFQINFNLLEL